MKIEAGKKYILRDGSIIKVTKVFHDGNQFPIQGSILEKYKDGTTLWGHTQNWELDGSWHPNHFNHVYDIVQEYEPTSVAFLKGLKNETP